jgi:hypothetical protein
MPSSPIEPPVRFPDDVQAVLDAARIIAENFVHSDEWNIEEDRSWCPYNRRHLPGADPDGSCSFGCQTEPDCQTSGPYPLDALVIAIERMDGRKITDAE